MLCPKSERGLFIEAELYIYPIWIYLVSEFELRDPGNDKNLNKRRNILRKRIILKHIILLTLGIVLVMLSPFNNLTAAAEALKDGNMTYGDKLTFNQHYDTELFVDGELAYCMQALKDVPDMNTTMTQLYYNNNDIKRTLYYGWNGQEQWSGFTSYAHGYVTTSRVLSHYYSGYPAESGLDSYEKAFIKYLESKDYIEQANFGTKNLTAKWDRNKNEFVTGSVTVKGTVGSITLKLQAGVKLVNETKDTSSTGTVSVTAGTKFHLEGNAALAGTAYKSGKVGSSTEFMPVILKAKSGNSSYQHCVTGSYKETAQSELNVEWEGLGELKIIKKSADHSITDKNAYYNFKGAVYGLFHKTTGAEYARVTLDENGTGTFKDVIYDHYFIQETEAPEGYLKNAAKYQIDAADFDANKGIILCDVSDEPQCGKVILTKVDAETGKSEGQGAGDIAGAVYEVKNWLGELVDVLTVASDGKATSRILPLGRYFINEKNAPVGYLVDETTHVADIRSLDSVTKVIVSNQTSKEQIKRGDLKGIKVSDGDLKRLADVSFEISSKSTGESHIVVTDMNGYFSTSADWNKHTYNTNRGQTCEDGVWFGESQPGDELGALPYDTYTVTELRCEANAEYDLIPSFEIVVSRDKHIIDLGTLTNDYTPVYLKTTASDENTGCRQAFAVESATIIDTVEYVNLVAGRTYTIKGVLMDKENGEKLLIDGKEIAAEKSFTAESAFGVIDLEYRLNAKTLAGRSVVVFETLYYKGAEIAAHADIEDEEQTITFPKIEIKTTARDNETDSKQSIAKEKVTIVDAVEFKNLIVGQEYTVKGVLMDRETEKELLVNRKRVTAQKTFTAEEANGSIDLDFTFDARDLAGKTTVVFEALYHNGEEFAVHADINDKAQTIMIDDVEKAIVPKVTGNASKTPQTGDDADMKAVVVMIGLAAAAIGTVIAKKHLY